VLPIKQERKRQEVQQQEEGVEEKEVEKKEEEKATPPQPSLQAGILQFQFIKSALTVNPCTVREHVWSGL